MLIFPQSKTAQIQLSSKDSRHFHHGRASATEGKPKVLLLSDKQISITNLDITNTSMSTLPTSRFSVIAEKNRLDDWQIF